MMKDFKLERRNFFKLIAGAVSTALIMPVVGCASEKKEEFEDNSEVWVKTGNKETKKAYTHLIWIYDEKTGEDIHDELAGEIVVPEGYAYVGSETIILDNLQYSRQTGIKYNFVNLVDVDADEYINRKTEEFGFPVAGKPIGLEKNENLPKTLSKTS